MGPFPHDAAPATISDSNPMGTDGFAFVEFAHPEPAKLEDLFRTMGFSPVAKHKSRAVTIWRQGDVCYLANAEPNSYATAFKAAHGPCAVGIGFCVVDPQHAYDRALGLGAKAADTSRGVLALDGRAIEGIGGSVIYLVPRGEAWMADFEPIPGADQRPEGVGLYYIDHLTHNVHRGRMDVWAGFYEKLFNFKEIRFFNIEGKLTGLISRAITSPCGKIRIPINESVDDKSQIEEYLKDYKGEGIQHIACGSRDIYATVENLRAKGLPFMPSPPDTYYEKVDARVPGHGEPLERLKADGILIDGEGAVKVGERGGTMTKVLLQIFSGTVLGPIFFEFIQRKGDEGFGEGNFRALFESIEEDQIRRGVLHVPDAAE
ncbi:4-hydroxyphenylpyruvate dioxygenase [Chelatococcus sp. SYSU_G07232]|uniref:4-hydroxyphenylpyruvate dioxygenase n=1 Tax=Chelatococcus albus TaxID=3047466 RepID=A0ABT7ALE1_9HYPH|nr:4-hydroxyphenylpyruvate dioxygenase [Chelatococcus sp. SYSU_G07232]MDJ1160201.1 4-hydroxyphenylpyruvate dioxygenase [Chelatococcus sp. SYSU_G07232]